MFHVQSIQTNNNAGPVDKTELEIKTETKMSGAPKAVGIKREKYKNPLCFEFETLSRSGLCWRW